MHINSEAKGDMQLLIQEFKKGKNIIAILLMVILLIIPLRNYVYHTSLYYLIVIFVLIPITFYRIIRSDTLEKKFYFKWGKKRKKGRLINILREGLRTIFFMLTVVLGSRYIVDGRTPNFILSKLSINQSLFLMLFILSFGAIVGMVVWYENEKRYKKIYLNSEDKEIIEQPPTEWNNTK